MWELDYKKSWALKNWCFCTVVLEKTLESPLDSKKIQPVHPEGNQSWMFIGRTGVEAEAPKFWPLVVKNWLIGKDSDARKDWRQEDKGTTRGWDDWTASPTQWTWAWVNSGSWWWTGRPGMLQSMGPQRVRHDWVTELNWILEFLVTVGKKKKKVSKCLMSEWNCQDDIVQVVSLILSPVPQRGTLGLALSLWPQVPLLWKEQSEFCSPVASAVSDPKSDW